MVQSAGRDFSRLIGDVRGELASLYLLDKPETTKRRRKTEILGTLSHSYERLRTVKWDGENYYAHWFEKPVNNARLALYNTYEGSQCAFQGLFAQAEGDLLKFHRLAEQKSGLQKEERAEWLKQPCLAGTAQGAL
jgi:predicted aminopeptidase